MSIRGARRSRIPRAVGVSVLVGALVGGPMATPSAANTAGAQVGGSCTVRDGFVRWDAGGTVAPRQSPRLSTQVYYIIRTETSRKVVIAKKSDSTANDHGNYNLTGRVRRRSGISPYTMRATMRGRFAKQKIWVTCRRGDRDSDFKSLAAEASCNVRSKRVRYGGTGQSNGRSGRLKIQLFYLIQTETTRKVVIARDRDNTGSRSMVLGGNYVWGVTDSARRRRGIRTYWAKATLRRGDGHATSYYVCQAG
jgi:hypothetical protein